MIPAWLHLLAILSLAAAAVCAIMVAVDVRRRPPHMAIMSVVWPLTALFGGPVALWFYAVHGRAPEPAPAEHPGARHAMHGEALCSHHGARNSAEGGGHRATDDDAGHGPGGGKAETPFWIAVAKGTCHCGSGCTLGDIIAEWLVFFVPSIALAFGWQTLFSEKIFAVWVLDYLLAFGFGVAFQYYAIKPMRDVSPREALVLALKADALSLTAWQVGMYGAMAIANFVIFARVLQAPLTTNSVEFWFMMQLAMLCGFATSYPVNWWLIRRGIKERM
ncbi:DUF4396 domain-containing protein [Acuticoccus sediminis]|uniref:DUF4396 domain-containing protein n=1 Tax=Acuticoccus sediminis TaxID=2184697 RepID=UPI001CFF4821|nr:DUF4396 domain-containing protein [Acuticoccus sediminis]